MVRDPSNTPSDNNCNWKLYCCDVRSKSSCERIAKTCLILGKNQHQGLFDKARNYWPQIFARPPKLYLGSQSFEPNRYLYIVWLSWKEPEMGYEERA